MRYGERIDKSNTLLGLVLKNHYSDKTIELVGDYLCTKKEISWDEKILDLIDIVSTMTEESVTEVITRRICC